MIPTKTINGKIEHLILVVMTGLRFHAGDNSWCIAINAESGSFHLRHNTYDNSGWVMLASMNNMMPEDDENLYPGDDGYNYARVANWIVRETDWIALEVEAYDENGEDMRFVVELT